MPEAGTQDAAIGAWLAELIAAKSPLPRDAGSDFDFIESGHVDSIGLIHFVLAVEEHYGIELDDDDLQSDRFRTLGGLTGLVADKLRRRAGGV